MAQPKSRAKLTAQELLDSFEQYLASPKCVGQLKFSQHEMALRTIRSSAAPTSAAPNLLLCTHASLLGAMMRVFALGLQPLPELSHVHLIPVLHHDELLCRLVIGYRGLLELAWRNSAGASLHAAVVHQNDYFRCRLGLAPQLEHVPYDMIEFDDAARVARLGRPAVTSPGAIVAAYCVATMKGGLTEFRVVTDVKRARTEWAVTNWKRWEEQLWAKEAILNTLQCTPLSLEDHLVKALEVDGCVFTDIDCIVDGAGTTVAEPATTNGAGAKSEARNDTKDAPELPDAIEKTGAAPSDVAQSADENSADSTRTDDEHSATSPSDGAANPDPARPRRRRARAASKT